MNHIVESYENYREEDRLTTNNARKIEFKIWCDYHYIVCRQKSILGASNHGLIIGRK